MKPELTLASLQTEAGKFAVIESEYPEPSLFGVTDGKAIGTYIEHKFKAYLTQNQVFVGENSATGIDLSGLAWTLK